MLFELIVSIFVKVSTSIFNWLYQNMLVREPRDELNDAGAKSALIWNGNRIDKYQSHSSGHSILCEGVNYSINLD